MQDTLPPRRPGANIPDALWARAIADYLDGAIGPEIHARYGIATKTLYARVSKLGIGKRRGLAKVKGARTGAQTIRSRGEFTPELWAQVREDREAGATWKALEATYGIKPDTMRSRALRDAWKPLPLPMSLRARKQAAEAETGPPPPAWKDIAHAAQKAPPGRWATWLFQGGRGAGKTRAGAEWLAELAEKHAHARFALVGATLHDVREVMIDGPSGLCNLPGRKLPRFEASRRRLIWENGAIAYTFSAEEPERLRGPQFHAAWADEVCVWPKVEDTLANLRMGLRLGADPRLVVTTTPKPTPAFRKLRAEPTCVVTQAGTDANAAHLAPTFLDNLHAIYGGTSRAAQELEGLLVDGEGALWRAEELARARGARPPGFDCVLVGVDPAVGEGTHGSACGIVAAGRAQGRYYVLADRTLPAGSALAWASRAVEVAAEVGARAIVAEVNQGGTMVRAMLASAGADCELRMVRASAGKKARAEPIAALYERGLVTHCCAFPALEEELMAMGAAETSRLDRADALVWALTALMEDEGRSPLRIRRL